MPPQGFHATSPTSSGQDRVRLYDPEFAADPHSAYRRMRERFGAMAPVELAPGVTATLILDYATALSIMRDPERFPTDPTRWQQSVPPECPVRPFLEARANALRTTGEAHQRLRGSFGALREIDLNRLHDLVGGSAEQLINGFCGAGSCDLLSDYAAPLTFQVLANLMGFPTDAARQAWDGMAAMMETVNAQAGQEMFVTALAAVVAAKRAQPSNDLTSALITDPGRLDDVEVINQAALLFSMGTEPLANLILHTMLLMLTEDRFGSGLISGVLSTEDALDEVLFTDPPLTNFPVVYPRQPILVDEVWLPADQPVLIGLAACNNDPRIAGGDRTGNRSHLAWGAGPHMCPAQAMARAIAQDAIDLLIDALPDMELAIPFGELSWRPGPFHRALVALPVEFPATAPMQIATSSRFVPATRL
ncbi:Cytochrome P450 monooxygenase PikC [Nocardia sp. RB20]|uniref:Cytochrome P450 monooxygenase PikC n=2 Tax=Nocardia macrotermitis TaxID=2585198 RepID=A0A7K0D4A1_9NOCA|nr:Cytochrome P450 monooxygenase PikC [Nocardia macrotermitis]